jgi:predicted transcriptional regulator
MPPNQRNADAKVRDAMSRSFASLREADSVAEALRRMDEFEVAVLPVIGERRTWKGLALRDELRTVHDGERAVRDLARPELALSPDEPVEAALRRLIELDRGNLPVVEGETVIGVLSRAHARSWLGIENRLLREWRPPDFTAPMRGQPTESLPIGPTLDREIDAALALLSSVPFQELQRRGWHLQPNHYYWPLNDVAFLREHPRLWTDSRLPADIEWDLDGQEQLLQRVMQHAPELEDVRVAPPAEPGEFIWQNGAFPRGDAYAYYGLVRELKPRHVIEVGSGWSSLLLARALEANMGPSQVTLIEPEPNWAVLGELPSGWQMIESKVQHVDIELFDSLKRGDVLFYDGSHCVRTASDVNWIFFEILPRLAHGVWVHIHDITWPHDYPPEWILDEGLSWNEQYLLQAFLMHNSAYRVRLAMNMLWTQRPNPGCSVWLEKVANG